MFKNLVIAFLATIVAAFILAITAAISGFAGLIGGAYIAQQGETESSETETPAEK